LLADKHPAGEDSRVERCFCLGSSETRRGHTRFYWTESCLAASWPSKSLPRLGRTGAQREFRH
jgi:hypothetical protein